MQFLKLQVHFGGDIHEVIVPSPDDPKVVDLIMELEKQFNVPSTVQRLIFKGQQLHEKPNENLKAFGVNNSSLIRMIGRKGWLDGEKDGQNNQ